MLSPEDQKICKGFALFDKDLDGKLNVNELENVFKALGQDIKSTKIEKLIDSVQSDNRQDGKLYFEEFLRLINEEKLKREDFLRYVEIHQCNEENAEVSDTGKRDHFFIENL